MSYFSIYVNVIRVILITFFIYYIYKHEYKPALSNVLVFALTFLPLLFEKLFSVKIDLIGGILYIVLIIMSISLGSALKFYDRYIWWDKLIHFISGIVFVCLGIAILKKGGDLNAFYMLFFSLTFSISLQVIWEVLEYILDCILHTDNQRWQKVSSSTNHVPESAIQPAGLVDTMNDMILNIAGTVLACGVWWFIL